MTQWYTALDDLVQGLSLPQEDPMNARFSYLDTMSLDDLEALERTWKAKLAVAEDYYDCCAERNRWTKALPQLEAALDLVERIEIALDAALGNVR